MTIESPPRPRQLQSVQALRGVAATFVVIFHAVEIWRKMTGFDLFPGPWDRGWSGVDLFFVISGFIMVWICTEPSSPLRKPGRFLYDRLTRIYPLWWIYCAVMASYFFLSYGQPSAPGSEMPGGPTGHFLQSMLLWPTGQLPVLGVGWTLTFELAFYAVFALFLLLPQRFWIALLAVWAIAIGLSWPEEVTARLPNSWLGVLLNPLCLQFIQGGAVAWFMRSWSVKAGFGWMFLLAGIFLFGALLIAGNQIADLTTHGVRALLFGPAGMLIVAGLVTLEGQNKIQIPSVMKAVGDSSYTLYLAHFIGLLAYARICEFFGLFDVPNAVAMGLFVLIGIGASLIGSHLAYRLIERPLLKLSRTPMRRMAKD